MALANEILVGRFNRFIQKLLSMKGPASLNQMSGEMQLALSAFTGVETEYLEGWDRFGTHVVAGPTAAQNSAARIRNPAGSNILAVVEYVAVNLTGGTLVGWQIGPTNADLGTLVGTITPLDARTLRNAGLIYSFSGTGVNLVGATPFSMPAPWTYPNFDRAQVPLLPGQAFQVICNQVNLALDASIIWRERMLEESEAK